MWALVPIVAASAAAVVAGALCLFAIGAAVVTVHRAAIKAGVMRGKTPPYKLSLAYGFVLFVIVGGAWATFQRGPARDLASEPIGGGEIPPNAR